MKTLGEVFSSQFGINLPQQISQGELTQLDINKQSRLIILSVNFSELIGREDRKSTRLNSSHAR